MKERTMKRRPGRRAQDQGFTLIELLISIALMMILIIAVTMIFVTTTDVVAVQEARMTVYTNARYAMDIMANDLLGAYGLNEPPRPGQKNGQNAGGGQTYIPGEHIPQQFWMDNGELPRGGDSLPDGGGELPVLNKSADPKAHYERAGDSAHAAEFHARAAEHARERFGHDAMLDHVAKALTLLNGQNSMDPSDAPLRWRLLRVRERTLDLQAWRAEQLKNDRSGAFTYAQDVLGFAQRFRERGNIVPLPAPLRASSQEAALPGAAGTPAAPRER
jgi:type II secretory pathway pseudopilin PulG